MLSGEFLHYGVVFLVLTLIAWFLGAREIAGVTMDVAKIFIVIFLVLSVITLVL